MQAINCLLTGRRDGVTGHHSLVMAYLPPCAAPPQLKPQSCAPPSHWSFHRTLASTLHASPTLALPWNRGLHYATPSALVLPRNPSLPVFAFSTLALPWNPSLYPACLDIRKSTYT